MVSHGLDGHSHEPPYDERILVLGAGTNSSISRVWKIPALR